MKIKELIQYRRQEILALAEKHGAYDVRIFGSVARGEDDEKSDIDILIKRKPGFSLLDHAGLINDLEDLLSCKVDVVTEMGLKARIKDRVLKEAVPLSMRSDNERVLNASSHNDYRGSSHSSIRIFKGKT